MIVDRKETFVRTSQHSTLNYAKRSLLTLLQVHKGLPYVNLSTIGRAVSRARHDQMHMGQRGRQGG